MTDDLDAFRVKTPSDVWATLRKLDEARTPLDIEFLRAPGCIHHACMEQLDAQSATFYLRLSIPASERLPVPTPLRLSSTQRQLKIQFDTVAMQASDTESHQELQVAVPRKLYRIQRRNAFRISNCPQTPITLKASLDGQTWFSKVLHDVSIGGCSFLFEASELPGLKAHTVIPHCIIAVPDAGDIRTTLEVRTVAHPRSVPSKTLMKAGCRFVDLPFQQEALIQRFIIAAEHKQKTAI